MSLQFIGDTGVYLPDRDAVKITAIAADSVIDCYVSRCALAAIGCHSSDQAGDIVEKFEARRLDCETAAVVKFRRATTTVFSLEVTAADLASLDPSREAYFRSGRRLQRLAERLGVLRSGPALPSPPEAAQAERSRGMEGKGLTV